MNISLKSSILWHAAIACILLAFGTVRAGATAPPRWMSGDTICAADLIAIVDGPVASNYVSETEVFVRGAPASIHQYAVRDTLFGEMRIGAEIVVVQPPSHMHGYAHILPGESLMLLKRIDPATVERLRAGAPTWADELPDELWTFVDESEQWMNWIQFSSSPDTRTNQPPRGILVGQLNRYAGVEPTKDAIVAYIKGLVELRDAVLADEPTPAAETLDVFQQDVVRAATEERGQREQTQPNE